MATNKTFTWSWGNTGKAVTQPVSSESKKKAREFLEGQWITERKAVNDFVLKNHWWDADAFFKTFETQSWEPTKTEWTTTQTDTWNVEWSQKQVDQELIDAQRKALEENKAREDEINTNTEERIAADQKFAEGRTKSTEEFFNKNEEIITKSQEELNRIEEEQISSLQGRIDRDAVLLKQKAESEKALLNAQSEKQRVENENLVRQAKIDVYIQQQQSAWGYNDIGLWFSSGIINQSQQIATNGIVRIAELQASMNFQEATITAKIAEVEFNYSSLVNKTIDTYTDKIDDLKKEAKKRATDVEKSLLKNNFDKKTSLDEIEQWARDQKRIAEQEHIADIEKVRDKGLELMEDIQASVTAYNTKELSRLDTALANGTIANMSASEKARKEAELWLPAGTIDAEFTAWVNTRIRDMFDQLAWEWAIIWDISSLTNEVKEEMKQWRTYDEAVNIVMEREVKNNPELQQAISDFEFSKWADARQKDREFNLDVAKLELDRAFKSWNLSVDQFNAETNRLKAEETRRANIAKESWPAWFAWGISPESATFTTPWGKRKFSFNKDWGDALNKAIEQWVLVDFNNMTRTADEQAKLYGKGRTAEQMIAAGLNPAYANEDANIVTSKTGLPWNTSLHQSNNAVDVVFPQWVDKVEYSKEMNAIMNPLGFFQNQDAIDAMWDYGHYEFKWIPWEREALSSKAIELGLDRKDVPEMLNRDLASYIDSNKENKTRAKINDATKPLLERLKKDSTFWPWDSVKTSDAKAAYKALLKDGFTPEEALDQMTLVNDQLIVKNWALYENDIFSDDFIFNPNK